MSKEGDLVYDGKDFGEVLTVKTVKVTSMDELFDYFNIKSQPRVTGCSLKITFYWKGKKRVFKWGKEKIQL